MAQSDPPQSPPKAAPKRGDPDAAMDAYLASVDLAGIQLDSDALLEDAKTDGTWVLVGLALWMGLLFLGLWLPSTLFYQLHPLAEAAQLTLWLVLAVAAVMLRRGVWLLVTAWPFGDPIAALRRRQKQLRMPQNLGVQWGSARVLGTAILALASVLVLLLPREVQWQGQGYTGGWFLASLAAIATGILVGRFIIAHASIERPQRPQGKPIKWPSWMRWATGAAIVVLGGVILAVHSFSTQGDHSNEFGLAGSSLALGVAAAIWLAKRFDELEAKWQKEAQNRQDEHNSQDL